MNLPATTQNATGPPLLSGRLGFLSSVAPRLAEAFAEVHSKEPNLLERDDVARLVCKLYVADPKAWRSESLPLPRRHGRGAMREMWRLMRDTRPELWAYLQRAWLDTTGQDLDRHARCKLRFLSRTARLLAEAITPCLVKLCVNEENL